MTKFIAENKQRFGVEPMCRVLTEHGVRIAPSLSLIHISEPTRPY